MKKIEAETLEEAYKNAAKELNCSVTEINYEIVQYPATGMMGLFKKPAIIIAVRKTSVPTTLPEKSIKEKSLQKEISEKEEIAPLVVNQDSGSKIEGSIKENLSSKESLLSKDELFFKGISQKEDKVLDSFFETSSSEPQESIKQEGTNEDNIKVEKSIERVPTTMPKEDNTQEKKSLISSPPSELQEEFFEHAFDDDRDSPKNRALSIEIEDKLKVLFASSCFEIDTVEVDVFNNTVHMFVDGEDAALLIGKEGYRYNALSYMLFNWINTQYNLYIKLEIAEFIQTQEEMIENYLKPIIEHINVKGRGKTKPLDGILVQIALEQLRATFPNKYVAIKTGKDGNKFIIINNFNNKRDV